jgi:hypothetical protein
VSSDDRKFTESSLHPLNTTRRSSAANTWTPARLEPITVTSCHRLSAMCVPVMRVSRSQTSCRLDLGSLPPLIVTVRNAHSRNRAFGRCGSSKSARSNSTVS